MIFSQISISGRNGTTAHLDPAAKTFRIRFTSLSWQFTGRIDGDISNTEKASGSDNIGSYRELTFDFFTGSRFKSKIRVYHATPVVLFICTFVDSPDSLPPCFPTFTTLPESLTMLTFSEREFGSPPIINDDFGHEISTGNHSGPVILFDRHQKGSILSPASDFMIANIAEDKGLLKCGLNPGVRKIPRGFTYRVILTAAAGINHTWDIWGRTLTSLYHKKRPENNADVGLKYLGYWTDNGATYYYNYDSGYGYEGTLLALKKHYDLLHIPIRYIQLDSWWYAKGYDNPDGTTAEDRKRIAAFPASPWNRFGGLLQYEPPQDLFPKGIHGFHDSIGLPLITHNRWISRDSPYRRDYKISGIGAVDPGWWDSIMRTISAWGVSIYEQDWLDRIYNFSPEFSTTCTAAESFTDGMSSACASSGLTMQYCMALPRHYLEGGAKYSDLTSIRVSGDRFDKNKWKEFFYGSRLAGALGIWPWCDVFMSSETPNILLATLSAGIVGIGDPIGSENLKNIFRAVRPDGVIVKPDLPIVPIDQSYIDDSRRTGFRIASTFTDHGLPFRTRYLFIYADSISHNDVTVNASQLDINGRTYMYDYFSGSGEVIRSEYPLLLLRASDAWSYKVFAPISKSGIAFIGDPEKFVTCGRQRVAMLAETHSGIKATLLMTDKEDTVTLCGYSPQQVVIKAARVKVGDEKYNPSTHLFSFRLLPTGKLKYQVVDGDTVARVPVIIGFR